MDIARGLGEVVSASRTTSNLFDKLGIRRSVQATSVRVQKKPCEKMAEKRPCEKMADY
jgi:hypothetical protein